MAQKIIKFISPEDFQKIYKAEKDKRVKLVILLCFGAGLRISEIIGYKRKGPKLPILPLKPENVNLEKHQIIIGDAKGGKWRIVVTPPALTEEMVKLLPITMPRRTLQERVYRLTERVLGKKLSIHTLRHGFGNYMANIMKQPLPMVQAAMGHSRLDTTGIYTKANPDDMTKSFWKAMGGEE